MVKDVGIETFGSGRGTVRCYYWRNWSKKKRRRRRSTSTTTNSTTISRAFFWTHHTRVTKENSYGQRVTWHWHHPGFETVSSCWSTGSKHANLRNEISRNIGKRYDWRGRITAARHDETVDEAMVSTRLTEISIPEFHLSYAKVNHGYGSEHEVRFYSNIYLFFSLLVSITSKLKSSNFNQISTKLTRLPSLLCFDFEQHRHKRLLLPRKGFDFIRTILRALTLTATSITVSRADYPDRSSLQSCQSYPERIAMLHQPNRSWTLYRRNGIESPASWGVSCPLQDTFLQLRSVMLPSNSCAIFFSAFVGVISQNQPAQTQPYHQHEARSWTQRLWDHSVVHRTYLCWALIFECWILIYEWVTWLTQTHDWN